MVQRRIQRVTEAVLMAALSRSRLNEKNAAIARAFFVEGKSQTVIANELGETPSNVSRVVKVAHDQLDQGAHHSMLVRSELNLPKSLADSLQVLSKYLLRDPQSPVVDQVLRSVEQAIDVGVATLAKAK